MTTAATVETIARALGQVSVSPQGYKCRCPAHEDKQASLFINTRGNRDGRPTVICHAGCDPKSIYAAIEETTGLHFEAREKPSNRTQDRTPSIYPAPIDWVPVRFKQLAPFKSWKYFNDQGELMFVVARYNFAEGKQIRPYSVHEVNGQHMWRQGLGGLTMLPLYNLLDVLERPNAPVLIVEGEKACDAAKTIPELAHFVPVTYQSGAKAWKKSDWTPLKGRQVFLWPDNDQAGHEQFYDLARMLNLDQMCAGVKVAVIPKKFPEKWDLADVLPEGCDISQVSWADAPEGGIEYLLESINPSNYNEVFDSLYWLVYDGLYRYTIEKKRYIHATGRPFDYYRSLQRINGSHPAHACCFIGRDQAIDVWATNKAQRGEYLSGARFRPGDSDQIIEDEGLSYLNTFTGFPFTADPHGDCTAIKNHILHVICDGDEKTYNYIWNYLSHIIQYPGEKPTSALVFKGLQGTGKTKLFEVISTLLGGIGGYATKVETMSQATGRFNNFMANVLVLWIEELELTGSRERENRLKTMITDPMVYIEAKGKDGYQDRNYARVMGATNHEHIWNVVQGERRLSLFEVSDVRKDDKPYFANIELELRKIETLRRLMFELENTAIDRASIFSPLVNKAKDKQAFYTPIPNRDLALRLLKAGEIILQIRDVRNEVVTGYHVMREDWERDEILIPSTLCGEVIDEMLRTGKFLESKFSAKDKRVTVTEMVRQMGAARKPDGKFPYTTIYTSHRGGQRAESGYRIPKLSEARKAFCESNALLYDDVFGEENNVLEFKPKAARQDDVPF